MTILDTPSRDAIHDFDFLLGRWTVANRRLADYFADDAEWQEFASASPARTRDRPLEDLVGVNERRGTSRHAGYRPLRGRARRVRER
jgi:hypothetical protein